MTAIKLGRKLSEETRRKIGKAKLGKNNPNWKGGVTVQRGYVLVLFSSRLTRYKKRARITAEHALGRELKPTEAVHHINQIRDDDRNENLLICSGGYHIGLHNKLRVKGVN